MSDSIEKDKKRPPNTFGFETEESFIEVANAYLFHLKEDLDFVPPQKPTERMMELFKRVEKDQLAEIKALEKHLEDPSQFYLYVRGIYDRLIELDQSGLSPLKVIDKFLEVNPEVFEISGFLDHGINQPWAYHFIQRYAASR